MFQAAIDAYHNRVEKNLTDYLASLPSPFETIDKYLRSEEYKDFTTEMLDVAGMTALLVRHKDTKKMFEPNAYIVELLTSMFRVANAKLRWLSDEDACSVTDMLVSDRRTEQSQSAFEMFIFCCRRFPYSIENQKFYAYLMPIVAYGIQHKFQRSNYFSRYMVNIINRYNLLENREEHDRDINYDVMKCVPTLGQLLDLCATDGTKTTRDSKYEFMRNVCIEYARVFLACMISRSSIDPEFSNLASEVVSYHYVLYQEISQAYFKQKQAKE